MQLVTIAQRLLLNQQLSVAEKESHVFHIFPSFVENMKSDVRVEFSSWPIRQRPSQQEETLTCEASH